MLQRGGGDRDGDRWVARGCPRRRSSSSTTTRPTARARSRAGWACGSSRSPSRARGTPSARSSATLPDRDAVILVDGDGTYPADAVAAAAGADPRRLGRHDRGRPPAGGRAGRDVAGPRAGQRPDPRRVPRPDRPRDGRPALGLPRVQPARSSRRVRSARRASRSRPSWPARPWRAGCGWSRSPCRTTPGSPGTVSKLQAFRDGRRILATILAQSLRHRPWRALALIILLVCSAAALAGFRKFALVAAVVGAMVITVAFIAGLVFRNEA